MFDKKKQKVFDKKMHNDTRGFYKGLVNFIRHAWASPGNVKNAIIKLRPSITIIGKLHYVTASSRIRRTFAHIIK